MRCQHVGPPTLTACLARPSPTATVGTSGRAVRTGKFDPGARGEAIESAPVTAGPDPVTQATRDTLVRLTKYRAAMSPHRELKQEIAVFGESGSGKTVLLSSFYGAAQEPRYLQENVFRIVADNIGQGARLQRNYLGMRNSSTLPLPTRFSSISYSFSLRLKDSAAADSSTAQSFDAVRLVWHDYPGEWFHEDVDEPEVANRRIETFKSLLGSDVAIVLVDGQLLVDNVGQEERYLKSLLSNFCNSLRVLKDGLLDDGQPLVRFPRIWIMALSKADLLPEMSVYGFRDLLIEKVCDEMAELREVIGGFVVGVEALSVGEDFVLLSSARFDPDKIVVTERIGVELILPIAAILPFERHARWARARTLPKRAAENLLRGAGGLARSLVDSKIRLPGPLQSILRYVDPKLIDEAAMLAGDALKRANEEAEAKHNHIRATLTGFKLMLQKAEQDEILARSSR